MNIKDVKQIKKTLRVLNNMYLSKVTWNNDMQTLFLHFRKVSEINSCLEANELKAPVEALTGEYAIGASCFFRFCYKNEVFLAAEDFYSADNVEEPAQARLNAYENFIVDTITVTNLGDVIIKFINRFLLEIRVDLSEHELCWRFFKYTDDYDLLAVTGNSLE